MPWLAEICGQFSLPTTYCPCSSAFLFCLQFATKWPQDATCLGGGEPPLLLAAALIG